MSDYDLGNLYQDVRTLILDSLDRADAKCDLSTRLIADLGAESLDFLDVAFRIERAFNVKIQRGRVERELRSRLPELKIKPNTDVTDDLKVILIELMPEIDAERIAELKKVKDISALFTVATFVRIAVQAILETRPGACVSATPLEGYSPQQLGVPPKAATSLQPEA